MAMDEAGVAAFRRGHREGQIVVIILSTGSRHQNADVQVSHFLRGPTEKPNRRRRILMLAAARLVLRRSAQAEKQEFSTSRRRLSSEATRTFPGRVRVLAGYLERTGA
jgi:hypothetical protein